MGGGNAAGDIFVRIGTTAPGSTDVLDAEYSANEVGDIERVSFSWAGSAGYIGPLFIEVWGSGLIGTLRFVDVSLDFFRVFAHGITGDPAPTLNTPYDDDELDDIQFVSSPFDLQTVFVHPDHPPQELILIAPDWVFREIEFHVDPGPEDPDWGGINGFPRACSSYQGRLILAGSPGEPQTVWATAPGNWYDIEINSAPVATDAVWLTLAARGAIRWVHGQKSLMVGASNAEHEVGSANQILQPGNVSAKVQSGYGSAGIQAVQVGEDIFYVGGDKKTVRGTNFNRDMQGWKSENKSWTAEHITHPGIRRIANARDPYQTVWMPLTNGRMAGLSYEPTYTLMGWHLHDTEGEFIDVCNAQVSTFDYTFFVVRRVINSETVFYLEAIREIQSEDDIRFSDSYVERHLGDPQSIVSGFDHLEGKRVAVVADGAVQQDRVVVAGAIILSPPASHVVAGLGFVAEMETLAAVSPPSQGGLSAAKSWSQIGVRLTNSAKPLINGVRVAERHPATPMNQGEPSRDEDITMVELGWDQYARINIKQDLPLPLTVTGIYGRLSLEEL